MGNETPDQCRERWAKAFAPLVGRVIAGVRWQTQAEAEACFGDDTTAIIITLDDGTHLYPSRDDEGNGAGALFIHPSTIARKLGVPDTAPVI